MNMANLNDTVLLTLDTLWNVSTDETADQFEERITRTITRRMDPEQALALAVDALLD